MRGEDAPLRLPPPKRQKSIFPGSHRGTEETEAHVITTEWDEHHKSKEAI